MKSLVTKAVGLNTTRGDEVEVVAMPFANEALAATVVPPTGLDALLDPQADLAEAIEFPSFVPASMNLLDLLRSMQRQRRGLAIVADEFGGTAGLVTVAKASDRS